MKKIHVCLYLFDDEVINYNDVQSLDFLIDCVRIITTFTNEYYRYEEFTRIEVDYYD